MTTDAAMPRSPLLLSRDQSVLLIIDAQVNMLLGENPVFQAGLVKANLQQLLEKARQ